MGVAMVATRRTASLLIAVALLLGLSPARGAVAVDSKASVLDARARELFTGTAALDLVARAQSGLGELMSADARAAARAGLQVTAAGRTATAPELRRLASSLRSAGSAGDASLAAGASDLLSSPSFRMVADGLAALADAMADGVSVPASWPPQLGDEVGIAAGAALALAGLVLNTVLAAPACGTAAACYAAVALTAVILSVGILVPATTALASALLAEAVGAVDDLTDLLQCAGVIVLFPVLAVQCMISVLT